MNANCARLWGGHSSMCLTVIVGLFLQAGCGSEPSSFAASDSDPFDAMDSRDAGGISDSTVRDTDQSNDTDETASDGALSDSQPDSPDTDSGTCFVPDPCGGCADGDFVPEGTFDAPCGPCEASRLTCVGGMTVCDMSECACADDGNCSEGEACTAGVCAPTGWAYVAPGQYAKGCTDAYECPEPILRILPRTNAVLSRGLLVRITEESEAAWQQVMGERVVHPDAAPGLPAVFFTFEEVANYLNVRSEEAALEPCYELLDAETDYTQEWPRLHACSGWRLPTEAEWEYFTRAGTDTRTWLGNPPIGDEYTLSRDPLVDRIAYYFPDVAALTNLDINACGTARGGDPETVAELLADFPFCRPAPVAEREANPWGLHDVLGNVLELVWDREGGNLDFVADVDPIRPSDTSTESWSGRRIRRALGGFYGDLAVSIQYLNAFPYDNDRPNLHVGFRAVRSLPGVRLGRTLEPR
jgi:formylglycine-generating enzyme required for sulfatase activity